MRVAKNRYGGWDATIEARDAATGRRRRVVRSARTKKEAEARGRDIEARLAQGLALGGNRLTVAEYLESWLALKERVLAPNTFRAYEQMLRLYVAPQIGALRLEDLTAYHLEAALGKMTQGQRTRHHTLMVLKAALRSAVKKKLIPYSPADGVEGVTKGRNERGQSLDEEGAGRLLAACEAEDTIYADAVAFALLTGMRHGEVLGLRWQDVEGGSLRICQALQRVTGQGMAVRPPKTQASSRTITAGALAEAVLARLSAREKVRSLHDAYVFAGVKETALRRHFKILLSRAGLSDCRFHDLRHSWASLALRAGVPLIEVQRHLGHSTISTTADTYSHLSPAQDAAAVAMFEALLDRAGRATAGETTITGTKGH